MSLLAGVLAWSVRGRRRKEGQPARLATAALCVAVGAVALQMLFTYLASEWIAPSMERRSMAAITAVIQGHGPVPAESTQAPAISGTEPDAAAVAAFAAKVRGTLGELQSVSKVHESIAGSPLAPTVTMALVLKFEKGSATGSAKLQWVPATEEEIKVSWLPSAHVLELDITMPDGSSAVVRGSEPPTTPPSPSPP